LLLLIFIWLLQMGISAGGVYYGFHTSHSPLNIIGCIGWVLLMGRVLWW
jgi:hypothetical protein